MRTNARMRAKFARRVRPDTHIEAVVALKGLKGPATKGSDRQVIRRYARRYGLTNTLGPRRMLDNQWLVVTENRVLLFSRRGSGLISRLGDIEHALERTEVSLQWADFSEAMLPKRLLHLTTTDQRMNISSTILGANDEANLLIDAIGDRGREIGLQEL